MEVEYFVWGGLCLSGLVTFLFSLFHIFLSSSSKIYISRYLEKEEKKFYLKFLTIYDDLRKAVGFFRNFFLIAFLVYLYSVFPRFQFWPLWLFLFSVFGYFILFSYLPQLIDSKFEKRVFSLFLHVHNLIYLLFKPFLLLFNIIVPKVEKERKVHEVSEEEIQAFINRAREEGIIEKDESALLRSVVEFGDTYVREIITPRVDIVCIERNETIKKIRNLVIQNKHSRIPVYRERIDNIEGIVLAKDLLEYSSDKWQKNSIESLIRPVHFVPESMKVTELLKELQKRKQKLAIVVDEHGGVSGLVTMEDLVEEIVGEIQDEYDKDDKSIQKEGPVSYIASGDVEIEEIEKLFNLVMEGNSYITLAGMITYHLGRLPRKGEHFEIKGLSLEILEIDKKRIKKLRIKPVVSQKE